MKTPAQCGHIKRERQICGLGQVDVGNVIVLDGYELGEEQAYRAANIFPNDHRLVGYDLFPAQLPWIALSTIALTDGLN